MYNKRYDKDYRWIARRRDTQCEVWRGLKCRSFYFHGIGICHPPRTWMCSPTQELAEPFTFEIFMEVSSCRHYCLLTSLLSGQWEMGLTVPRFWLWLSFFLVISPHSGSHQESAHKNKRYPHFPGNANWFRSGYHLGNYRVLRALCQESETNTYIIFIISYLIPSLYLISKKLEVWVLSSATLEDKKMDEAYKEKYEKNKN